MPSLPPVPPVARSRLSSERGSLLLVAAVFAAVISLVLVSYLELGRTSLKVAHRSFFANDAANLAEAGLEEALYCFNQMGAGMPPATAWSEWTISGTDAMYTLPPFNRDQNAVGVVKVYVTGYDGSDAAPSVLSQAVITPFDGGAPVVKTLQVTLKSNASTPGLVALRGLTLNGATYADSFDSNPTDSPTGPWVAYSSGIARSKTAVVVLAGSISINTGKVYGDLYLGAGVSPPAASKVTGTITTGYSKAFPMPAYPTPASVSRSYDVGSTIPATLPAIGHLPASDGRYYYFCRNTTIGSVTIRAGKAVTIVGTNTGMTYGLTIQNLGTCIVYMDRTVTLGTNRSVNSTNWAGALQIFTTTTGNCSFANNSRFVGCLYAPNARLTASGSGGSGRLVGYFVAGTITTSNAMNFHYDEALDSGSSGGSWTVTNWLERQSAADRASVAGLTNNFLR
ncbi:MAG: hypothetical protein PHE83_12355 [Opitutaceae bacterium]|nr:hypothetical protein [Opitutaceae bacterium]